MKLRNKKTGEVFDAIIREKGGGGSYSFIVCDIKAYEQSKCTPDSTHYVLDEYETLAELNEEWEDYEELTKSYWFINDLDGEPIECDLKSCSKSSFVRWSERRKQIGNYFETKEEAEKAVEKLKALKRLEDRGVVLHSFEGYEDCDNRYRIIFSVRCDRYWSDRSHSVDADLNLLFGGGDD